MVNLWQIANSISQQQHINHLPLSLQGVGGEIGSGNYYRSLNLPPTLGGSQMLRMFLSSLVAKDSELLTQETGKLSKQSVREICHSFLDDGFEPQAVPDAFYTFDRVRRWAETNTRKLLQLVTYSRLFAQFRILKLLTQWRCLIGSPDGCTVSLFIPQRCN